MGSGSGQRAKRDNAVAHDILLNITDDVVEGSYELWANGHLATYHGHMEASILTIGFFCIEDVEEF